MPRKSVETSESVKRKIGFNGCLEDKNTAEGPASKRVRSFDLTRLFASSSFWLVACC